LKLKVRSSQRVYTPYYDRRLYDSLYDLELSMVGKGTESREEMNEDPMGSDSVRFFCFLSLQAQKADCSDAHFIP